MATEITAEQYQRWLKKRRRTFIVYLLQYFGDGLAATLIVTVLWIYVRDEVPGKNKTLLYGLISSIRNLPAIFFSIATSRWVDKTRNAKQYIIFSNILSIIGIVLFMFPMFTFSAYLLAAGRFLDGFVLTSRVTTNSEISRSFPNEKLPKILPLCFFARLVGQALGPVVALCFSSINVHIHGFHLTWGNSAGLFVLALKIFQTIMLAFFSHNISKEFDLKQSMIDKERKKGRKNDAAESSLEAVVDSDKLKSSDDIRSEEEATSSVEVLIPVKNTLVGVLVKLVANTDTLILLIFTGVADFWESVFYRAVPFIITETLHFSTSVVTIFFVVYSLIFMLILYVVITVTPNDKQVYHIGVGSFLTLIIVGVCCIFISGNLPKSVNYLLLGMFCVSFSFYEQSEAVFLTVLFAKMMTSANQGVGTGLRAMVQRIGTVPGAFFSLYVYKYFNYSSIALCVTVVCILIFMRARKSSFCNPKPMV